MKSKEQKGAAAWQKSNERSSSVILIVSQRTHLRESCTRHASSEEGELTLDSGFDGVQIA